MLPHSGLPARAGSAHAPPPKDPALPLTSGRGTASSSALQSAPAVWLAKVEEVRVVAKTLFWWPAVRAWPLQALLEASPWCFSRGSGPPAVPPCGKHRSVGQSAVPPARLWYPPWVCIEWRRGRPSRSSGLAVREASRAGPGASAAGDGLTQTARSEAPRGSGDCLPQWGWPQARVRGPSPGSSLGSFIDISN